MFNTVKGVFAASLVIILLLTFGCEYNIKENIPGSIFDDKQEYTSDITRYAATVSGELNPLYNNSYDLKCFMENVYEPLFYPDKNFKAIPCLANGAVSDGKTVTVSLKQGVVWHDGSVFCADDVVYTINKIISGETTVSRPQLERVQKIDAQTVSVLLKYPVANFELVFDFPIMKANSTSPIGTGPYYYVGKVSVDEYAFDAFSGYREGTATGRKVLTDVESDEIAEQMFASGETDVMYATSSVNMANGKTNVIKEAGTNMVYLGFNYNNSVLGSVNVRRAVASAIDKSSLVKKYAPITGEASDYAVHPDFWVKQGTQASFDYNMDNAEKYMKGEGWELRGRLFIHSVTSDEARISLLAKDDDALLAEYIANTLTAFGIETSTYIADYDEYNSLLLSRDFDMFIGEADMGSSMDYFILLGNENVFGYMNASLSAKTMAYIANPASADAYTDCLNEIKNEVPFAPLYFKNNLKCESAYSGENK